jgi:16S rRNA (uracil1498-N3)-methyltransferase
MRHTRIYHPEVLSEDQRFTLGREASHHVAQVLRIGVGEKFTVFDGCDHEYQVEVSGKQGKILELWVQSKMNCSRESPCKIHLAQGIAKGDRWLFSLQKAVELGVDEITPLWTSHVAYKWDKQLDEKKIAQWQGIIVAACEQSGRTRLPILHPITRFQDFVQAKNFSSAWILDPVSTKRWHELKASKLEATTVLIGPEGGFSTQEYQLAAAAGIESLSLGPRILRTETAVVAILSLLQALYGDL